MSSALASKVSNSGLGCRFAALLLRILCLTALAGTAAVLLFAVALVLREPSWLPPPQPTADINRRNQEAFFHGTIGTELAPLPVLVALPAIFPEHFQPRGSAENGDWRRQFGFLPSMLAPVPEPRGLNTTDLPLGFTLSNYRPRTGAPSPVLFVGLACATCHTTVLRREGQPDYFVIGTGNTALNLFAWIDAFQAAITDNSDPPRLTLPRIIQEYEKTYPPLSLEERAMIALWLSGARAKLQEDMQKFDQPFGGAGSLNPDLVPTGPGRTQPFRTLVRSLLHRPGTTMKVYTKIAAVYWQELENGWGQFDGGIHGLERRSSGAAFAAGATVENMNLPEIANNIKWASAYLEKLKGPRFEQVFPHLKIDTAKVARGKKVYLAHCDRCHGHPEPLPENPADIHWVPGPLQDCLTLLADIKTDPERVTFRYYEEIPDALSARFPKNHPFDFPRSELRPAPGDPKRGYWNKPIPSAFSRAPFLHNASVLTLKELIHLDDRKTIFFRGENLYDPEALGLHSPSPDHGKPPKSASKLPFQFDTRVPGNSNRGHDYPWPREDVKQDPARQEQLQDLLEYLKTL